MSNQARSFRDATRKQYAPLPAQVATAFGQRLTFQLPVTGYLSRILLEWHGTMTTGAGTAAGNWTTYPMVPYNYIKRVRLYTSENTNICDLSGQQLYLANLMSRRNCTPDSDAAYILHNANNRLLVTDAPAGAGDDAVSEAVAGYLEVPIETDDMLQFGLLISQNLEVRLYLDVEFADAADVHGITGVTVTPAITFAPSVEFFSIPPDGVGQPNLQWVQTLLGTKIPIAANGDQEIQLSIGNLYLGVYGFIENNGALIDPTSGLTEVRLQYAQNVVPLRETYRQHVMRVKTTHGITLPDGAFAYDWASGLGFPGMLDFRDVVNSAEQTDLKLIVTTAGLTLSNAYVHVIRRQLGRIG